MKGTKRRQSDEESEARATPSSGLSAGGAVESPPGRAGQLEHLLATLVRVTGEQALRRLCGIPEGAAYTAEQAVVVRTIGVARGNAERYLNGDFPRAAGLRFDGATVGEVPVRG